MQSYELMVFTCSTSCIKMYLFFCFDMIKLKKMIVTVNLVNEIKTLD